MGQPGSIVMTNFDRYRMFQWIEQNREYVEKHNDTETSSHLTGVLGVQVTKSHVREARKAFGITKYCPAHGRLPHIEYTDEDTQVKINTIAHALITLFQILGEDNRPACRALQERFPKIGGVNG